MARERKSTPERALRRGVVLGKYRLAQRLGEGGFSEVWRAKDIVENRWVALKLPQLVEPGSLEEEELLAEVRLSARLDHPNILRTRNADRIGDRYVIASDLADETLEERIARRLGTRRALHFVHQILEGLAFAHGARVIHRDLKPSNLMIFDDDRVLIADFGLAKVAKHTMISATGSGTVLYVAPEQAHGYPCFASDIFSLGLIVHQMLTGSLPRWPFEWPFEGHATLRGKVPTSMVEFVRMAVQRDHRDRFHDAGAMLRAFEEVLPEAERYIARALRKRTRARQVSRGGALGLKRAARRQGTRAAAYRAGR